MRSTNATTPSTNLPRLVLGQAKNLRSTAHIMREDGGVTADDLQQEIVQALVKLDGLTRFVDPDGRYLDGVIDKSTGPALRGLLDLINFDRGKMDNLSFEIR